MQKMWHNNCLKFYKENNIAGFSLLEVMIAALIVSIAIVGFYMTFLHTQTMNRLNRENQLAAFVCRKNMEQLLAESWENLLAKNGEIINVPDLQYPDGKKNNGVIEIESSNIQQNILTIIVTVYWKSFGQKRTITLRTFYTKK